MNSLIWRGALTLGQNIPKEHAKCKILQHLQPNLLTLSLRNLGDSLKDRRFKKVEDRDRRVPIDVEVSIDYMKSDAFKQTYKDYKIWQLFRRNFQGQRSPSVPRLSCVHEGFIHTGNPCVVCRDRYLVLDYKNIELINHFISPHTGYLYPNSVLCLCTEQYENLCVAVTKAKSFGLIDFDVPLREYNYCHHYEKLPTNFSE